MVCVPVLTVIPFRTAVQDTTYLLVGMSSLCPMSKWNPLNLSTWTVHQTQKGLATCIGSPATHPTKPEGHREGYSARAKLDSMAHAAWVLWNSTRNRLAHAFHADAVESSGIAACSFELSLLFGNGNASDSCQKGRALVLLRNLGPMLHLGND
eukprot:681274-Amphidinium_carterae.1